MYTSKDRKSVIDRLRELDYEPIDRLVELATSAKSEHVQCMAAMDILSYICPKLKSIQISGDESKPFVISLNMRGKSISNGEDGKLIEGSHVIRNFKRDIKKIIKDDEANDYEHNL